METSIEALLDVFGTSMYADLVWLPSRILLTIAAAVWAGVHMYKGTWDLRRERDLGVFTYGFCMLPIMGELTLLLFIVIALMDTGAGLLWRFERFLKARRAPRKRKT